MTTDILCEATRDSNMICPTTCGCHNSLRDIEEKTHIFSQTLRSTRLIRKNELIAVFGFTAAITNKPEILALKQAMEERNSDLYRTSIQYTIQGNIHGKEIYLVPPQDAVLLLQDRISPGLRKQLKHHNTTEGLGQFANHTCCDTHWNANLEVAAEDHHEETTSEPMGILRAKNDIEPDTEILTRYWHTTKDAWLTSLYANVAHAQITLDWPHTPRPQRPWGGRSLLTTFHLEREKTPKAGKEMTRLRDVTPNETTPMSTYWNIRTRKSMSGIGMNWRLPPLNQTPSPPIPKRTRSYTTDLGSPRPMAEQQQP